MQKYYAKIKKSLKKKIISLKFLSQINFQLSYRK